MPTVDELRARYAGYSAEELRDLAAKPSDLTPDAQGVLHEEITKRNLVLAHVPESAMESPPRPQRAWHSGWLTVFEASITLMTLAFVAGFFLARRTITFGAALLFAMVVGLTIFGLLLIATRQAAARPFWLVCLGLWFVYVLAAPLFAGSFSPRILVNAATVGAWFLYWLRSKRIAEEFSKPSATETPTV